MARPLRIEYSGATYHVTARGNERTEIFRDKDDHQKLLDQLQLAQQRHALVIHAYVLMSNHYHLLLETPDGNLSQAMHLINGSYTGYFNRRHRRVGHLFQGRYKSLLVEKESYLLELSRYIHLNPVRAGMVKHPEEYHWSSYRTYIGKGKEEWIYQDWVLGELSSFRKKARKAYREFVEEALEKTVKNPLEDVFAQVVLGSSGFIEGVQKRIEEREPDYDVPEIKELKKRPSLSEIECLVAKHYGVEQKRIQIARQRGNIARQVGIYLARKYTGKTLKEISQYFGGMRHTGVSQGARRIEKRRRQDLQLDQELRELESSLQRNIKCQV